MKIIKIVMAMGILSCLFFPLSQCTGVPGGHPEPSEFDQKIRYDEADNIQESSSNVHQVISGIDDIKDIGNLPIWLSSTIFFAKNLLMMPFPRRSMKKSTAPADWIKTWASAT